MTFTIPRKTVELKLSEYAAGFDEIAGQAQKFFVWVNPPRRMIILHDDIQRRANKTTQEIYLNGTQRLKIEVDLKKFKDEKTINELMVEFDRLEGEKKALEEKTKGINSEMIAWLSEIWSQGPEGSHLSTDEVKQFLSETMEADPAFNVWIIARTARLISEHSEAIKKGLPPRF